MSNTDREAEMGQSTRRSFVGLVSSSAMAFGLAAGYGMFATLMGWFLYPFRPSSKSWQFVANLDRLSIGESLTYQAPNGASIVLTRLGETGDAADFIALSSTCPHLGCQVHWESPKDRFFCPCHNGAFDSKGNPTEGPPKVAKQKLSRYPLKVEGQLLFIEVPMTSLV